MTTKKNNKRNSLCNVCGKRVSVKTESGEIRWQPSHVVDEGLFCDVCFRKKDGGKPARKNRS
jgi:hypothetical protein